MHFGPLRKSAWGQRTGEDSLAAGSDHSSAAGQPLAVTPSARFDVADRAEADYVRMWRLRHMDAGQLRRLVSGDPKIAAPWILSAARYGIVEAQTRLGQMYLDGAGLPCDQVAAVSWFTRAADKGAPEAMNMVGRCYENGWGVAEDLSSAAQWYRRSAEAGYDWGEYNYANMLFDGRGVACDRRQSVYWYQRAAQQGHARAMNLLARSLEQGWGVARDPARALEWYSRSAHAGYFRAQFNFATVLASAGRIDEALVWFQRACQTATPDSQRGMAEMLARHANPRLADLGSSYRGLSASRLEDQLETVQT